MSNWYCKEKYYFAIRKIFTQKILPPPQKFQYYRQSVLYLLQVTYQFLSTHRQDEIPFEHYPLAQLQPYDFRLRQYRLTQSPNLQRPTSHRIMAYSTN